ncbi:MAG: RNA methyltransferase [Peptococcaceae bacterium]|nr:RNA methyltransferase [Peptococcaceae bacterium]
MIQQLEMIQSEQNQWLKRCKALQQKKYRQQYGQFVAEGLRFVQEALENQAAQVVLLDEGHAEMLDQLNNGDTPVYLVKTGLLAKALNTVNPQGIAAIAQQKQWNWQDVADMKQIIIIDGVQDPGNLGTIMRTALASDTQAMICLKGTVDLYNDKTLRSTMGAVFRLPVYHMEDAESMRDDLHKWGFQLAVADIRAEQYHYQMQFPEKTALVVSNEANGPQLIKEGDIMVKIPLYQQAESLNVAVAAGTLLYAIRTGREEK